MGKSVTGTEKGTLPESWGQAETTTTHYEHIAVISFKHKGVERDVTTWLRELFGYLSLILFYVWEKKQEVLCSGGFIDEALVLRSSQLRSISSMRLAINLQM